ncbi:MAG: hypothetical protein NTX57_21365 [Armatimonadetes bacterium]|nr:hypothetical protein [Armatimonadota bacterium]
MPLSVWRLSLLSGFRLVRHAQWLLGIEEQSVPETRAERCHRQGLALTRLSEE